MPSNAENIYRSIFDQCPMASVILGPEKEIVDINQQALDLLKLPAKEAILSQRFIVFLKSIAQKITEREPNLKDVLLELNNGRQVKLSAPSTLADQNGYITLSFEDASQELESKLNPWDKQLNNVLEFLPEPTMAIDLDGKVVIWNNAMENVSGVKKEDIIGKGDFEYSLPFYDIRRPILVDMVLDNGKTPMEMYTLVQRSGEFLYGEIYTPNAFKGKGAYLWGVAAPLKDDSGEVIGAIECMRNVTDRKMEEKELERAKIEAEAATKAKTEFLARMSHEIRTPMNSIMGMGELLLETKLDYQQMDYVETLYSSGEMLLTLINDLLDFSKIEADNMELESVPFELHDLVSDVTRIVKKKAQEKSLTLTADISSRVNSQVLGDPSRIKQVLLNLLSNAIKFTHEGNVALHVEPEIDTDGNDTLLISVSDTGIGISDEHRERIFDSFSQADTSMTRNFGGTGLGLAISKKLIDIMGGKIWVESVKGEGSTFFFTLPLKNTDLAPISTSMLSNRSEVGESGNLNALTLLLVEDIATNRKIVKHFLQNTDMKIIEAVNGKEAVDTYMQRDGRFDVILMDQEMPIMDGLHATKEIRRLEKVHNMEATPIIALSAHAFNQYKDDLLNAGCNAFLSKPVKKNDLITALENEISFITPEPESVTQDASAIVVNVDSDLQELVPDFLEELNDEMKNMAQAIEDENFEDLRRLAHGYKGASGNYDIKELFNLYLKLENAAKAQDKEKSQHLFDDIAHFLQRMKINYTQM